MTRGTGRYAAGTRRSPGTMTLRMKWEATALARRLKPCGTDAPRPAGRQLGLLRTIKKKPEGMTQPPPRRGEANRGSCQPAAGRRRRPRPAPLVRGRGRGPGVRRAPSGTPGVLAPAAQGCGWQAARLAERHHRLGEGCRFPDKKRHEVVDTFLPVPVQNYSASGAARKSRAGFSRFLPRMSLQLRRGGHEGLKN